MLSEVRIGLFSQCDPAGRGPAKLSTEELHRNKSLLREAHNSLRIAKSAEKETSNDER